MKITLSKNVTKVALIRSNGCRSCFSSNAVEPPPSRKIIVTSDTNNNKIALVSQWKLIRLLKQYCTNLMLAIDDKTFTNALNKEFAHFLQKIQPSVYGTDLIRYFENVAIEQKSVVPHVNETAAATTTTTTLQWKLPGSGNSTCTISKQSIVHQTQQLMSRINSSTITTIHSEVGLLTRIAALNTHLKQHHEMAKHVAVKEGAIRSLLKIRRQHESNNKINDENQSTSMLWGLINETLAMLGHVDPVAGRGLRILSLDGGGVRGILVIEMLKRIEELTGRSVRDLFDYICGVSTGAIIASLIAVKRVSLDEITQIYRNLSTEIFTQSTLRGTSNLVWSHAYYDTALWERLLQKQIGKQTLISTNRHANCPKLCALSAVVNQSQLSAYLFRNYSLPVRVHSQYQGNHSHLVWEAVRASAAAPTYFEEFQLGNMLHQDGGILFNNPTAVALHEAKLLWPDTPIQCVLSFGTGRTTPTAHNDSAIQTPSPPANSSWRNKFYAIIDSATDTEGVHTALSDLLPPDVYYRFNPYLTEMLDIAEIDPVKLEQLERDALMYLSRNEDKFRAAANALNAPKRMGRRVRDWTQLQFVIYG